MAETEVSLKNTKAEIFEALKSALERAEIAEENKLNPAKEEKEKVEKRAVAETKKAVESGNIFSKELNEKFENLQLAIATEENRLQELYGLGQELQKLVLVIESGKAQVSQIEAEKTEKEAAAKLSLESLKQEFENKQKALQDEYAQMAAKFRLEQTRETEEYDYNLKRKRELEENTWEDKKSLREAELRKREVQAKELLADAEGKIDYIQTLEEKVEGFAALINSEKEAAITANTADLKKEFSHQIELTDLESKNTIARLEDKIVSLEKQLEASNKAVDTVQAKLDKAYSEIRDLAAKTVESASNFKIIGNTEKNHD